MKQMLIGFMLGIATIAAASYATSPEVLCRTEASRVWNETTLNEHRDLQRGDRVTLSEDGRNAAWWMVGCRTGVLLAQ